MEFNVEIFKAHIFGILAWFEIGFWITNVSKTVEGVNNGHYVMLSVFKNVCSSVASFLIFFQNLF